MFVFVSQKILTSNKNVFYCVTKFKWSEQMGSYWRQLSDKIMSLYTHLLGRRIFLKEFVVLMKHTFYAWHYRSARIVFMKHTLLASRMVFMKHTLSARWCSWNTFCAWHTFTASRMVFMKLLFLKWLKTSYVGVNSSVFARTNTRKRQAIYV